jgi:hypothetical protein
MDATIDWMSFTVPYTRRFAMLEFIPGGVEWLGRGWQGYSEMGVFADTGRVGVCPERPEMGVHFSVSSRALAVLAGQSDFWADLPGAVAVVLALGGHFTRVDVALDDREGLLDLGTMLEHLEHRWFTSRWRKGFHKRGLDLAGGGYDGNTLELGKRVSDAMLRCYDKRLERIQAGDDDPGHWVRVELELKRERADAAAHLYANREESAFFAELAGVVRGYIEFKDPNGGDTNRRRWPVAAWWLAFLEGAEKARLTLREAVKRTVDHVREWIAKQVAPSLAVVVEYMGERDAVYWLKAEARDGRRRWKGRHKAILRASGLPAE